MKQENIQTIKRSSGRRFLSFFLSVGLLCLLFLIIYKLSGEMYKQNQIDNEIDGLQSEIEQLSRENGDLDELISYLQTDDFKEKEAKDKLNLIKEGEQLVLVKEFAKQEDSDKREILNETEVVVHHTNYYYWWYYFFGLKR